jgi:hypothetical protein
MAGAAHADEPATTEAEKEIRKTRNRREWKLCRVKLRRIAVCGRVRQLSLVATVLTLVFSPISTTLSNPVDLCGQLEVATTLGASRCQEKSFGLY